jgi:hypothetical protein
MSEGVTLEDGLEFGQEFKGVFDVSEFGEILIDEVLKLSVQSGDLNIELDIVLIKLGLLELKKRMTFGSEIIHLGFKLKNQVINPFKIMLL